MYSILKYFNNIHNLIVSEEKIRMYDAGKDKKYTEILKNKLEVSEFSNL